jgi:hypothetical protein
MPQISTRCEAFEIVEGHTGLLPKKGNRERYEIVGGLGSRLPISRGAR